MTGGGLGNAVSIPGIADAGSLTQVGAAGASAGANGAAATGAGAGAAGTAGSSQSASSISSSSSSQTLQTSDSFGFGELSQVLGSAGRKKRALPNPAHGSSSSFIDKLIKKKRNANKK